MFGKGERIWKANRRKVPQNNIYNNMLPLKIGLRPRLGVEWSGPKTLFFRFF